VAQICNKTTAIDGKLWHQMFAVAKPFCGSAAFCAAHRCAWLCNCQSSMLCGSDTV